MTISSKPDRPVIHMDFAPGNLGNKVLQYFTALKLRDRIAGATLSNIAIPEWSIDIPDAGKPRGRTVRYESAVTSRIDFDDIARRVERDNVLRVELSVYSSHIDNLPEVAAARRLLPLKDDAAGYGADVLLINIRGAEILTAIHPDYTVIPVSFYESIIAETGLRPVFFGQVDGESRYLDQLREAFPHDEFVGSRGALHDFSVIAKSKNIVIAVSTFSWLAGWLSEADMVIMPMSGFYNPIQYPAVNLVPADDPRYRFYIFPINYAVIDADIVKAHAALKGSWRPIGSDELRQILAENVIPAASPMVMPGRLRRLFGKIVRRVRQLLPQQP